MKKILVLTGRNYKDFNVNNINVEFCDIYNREIPFPLIRALRNTCLIQLCLQKCWKRQIDSYDYIILFDTDATIHLIKWLSKKNKNAKLIFYYRNTISSKINKMLPNNIEKYDFECWSYNLHDCQKYNLKYNSQFIQANIIDKYSPKSCDKKYDIAFVGYSKGREKILRNIYRLFKENGYLPFFYIPDLKNFEGNMCLNGKSLKYKDYIEIISKSKIVLDLVVEKNYGLTMRPLETLYLKEKVLTNYKDIKDYDFYSSKNILVFDDYINKEKIKNFLEEKIIDNKKIIYEKYDTNSWINNFIE